MTVAAQASTSDPVRRAGAATDGRPRVEPPASWRDGSGTALPHASRRIALAAALAALLAPPAGADSLGEMLSACYARTESAGQAASILSSIGWQVGGAVPRAVEARAMVLPYLSGLSAQDLRRNALAHYLDPGLARAAEEAARSVFMTSPEGHTLMMTHDGAAIDCTLALAPGSFASQVLDALPNWQDPVTDPQMVRYRFAPDAAPTGVTGADGALWDADARDFTQVNPVRPRDVDLIVTARARMQ